MDGLSNFSLLGHIICSYRALFQSFGHYLFSSMLNPVLLDAESPARTVYAIKYANR